jgi:hypothetical protein
MGAGVASNAHPGTQRDRVSVVNLAAASTSVSSGRRQGLASPASTHTPQFHEHGTNAPRPLMIAPSHGQAIAGLEERAAGLRDRELAFVLAPALVDELEELEADASRPGAGENRASGQHERGRGGRQSSREHASSMRLSSTFPPEKPREVSAARALLLAGRSARSARLKVERRILERRGPPADRLELVERRRDRANDPIGNGDPVPSSEIAALARRQHEARRLAAVAVPKEILDDRVHELEPIDLRRALHEILRRRSTRSATHRRIGRTSATNRIHGLAGAPTSTAIASIATAARIPTPASGRVVNHPAIVARRSG